MALGEVKGVPFIGLPGQPVSVFVTFLMLARPFTLRCQGMKHVEAQPLSVPGLTLPGQRKATGRNLCACARNAKGGLDLYPMQNSQILTSCAWADGLADIPAGTSVAEGDFVSYYPFRDLFI